jgi:trehalose-phosphatase
MILLMLDYDGTLTPIRSHPKQAKLSAGMLNLLDRLGRSPDIILAIISGRSLINLKELVPVRGIYFAGCHGLEISGPGIEFSHAKALGAVSHLKNLNKELGKGISKIPGVLIEDKGLSIAIHFRNVSCEGWPALKREIGRLRNKYPALLCQSGRKVYDFRPDVRWDKGKAVEFLIDKLKAKNPFPVYMGDDDTDEDAFKAIRGRGLGILVANREKYSQRSHAACRLSSIYKVKKLLESLI